MRHKHADLIIAWAEGAIIQFKALYGWVDLKYPHIPTWNINTEYRIKPSDIVVEYKRYIHQINKNAPTIQITNRAANDFYSVDSISGFVCWVDTEWQVLQLPGK